MHIAFVDIATSYTADSPYTGALGGTQAAVCYLGAALAKAGVAVTLINQKRDSGETRGVHNLPPENLDDDATLGGFTHIVFNGRWTEKMIRSLRPRTTAKFVGWMHEACFQSPYILPLEAFDGMVFVSQWQHRLNAARIPQGARTEVIANGIAPFFHTVAAEKAAPRVAVYAGSSKRGLLALPALLPLIHAAHPALRFEIYSDAVVAMDEKENRAFRGTLRALPNLDHLGGVDQATLAQRFARAAYLISPNAYPETFCIVLAEAMAAGLRCIATARAALPETAHGFAALMPFDHPDEPGWIPADLSVPRFAAFATDAIAAWENEPHKESQLDAQRAYARSHYSWAQHAAHWQRFLAAL